MGPSLSSDDHAYGGLGDSHLLSKPCLSTPGSYQESYFFDVIFGQSRHPVFATRSCPSLNHGITGIVARSSTKEVIAVTADTVVASMTSIKWSNVFAEMQIKCQPVSEKLLPSTIKLTISGIVNRSSPRPTASWSSGPVHVGPKAFYFSVFKPWWKEWIASSLFHISSFYQRTA